MNDNAKFPAATITGKILKVCEWPAADRTAWIAAAEAKKGLFDEADTPEWRPSTRELFERCYGGYLMWLSEQGMLDPACDPANRVTKERVMRFMQDRKAIGNSYRTLENYGTGLRHIMRVLAPSEDWGWLLPMIEKFKKAQVKKPMTGLPSSRELFELGIAVMDRAEDPTAGTVRDRAFPYRNGLAVALLAVRPIMRRRNLGEIQIGKNLVKEAGRYVLSFPDDEMKQKTGKSVSVPEILTGYIDRYLAVYRPAIVNGKYEAGPALWLSHMGGPIHPKYLGKEITNLTQQAFGKRVSPHKFRHCAGTSIATEAPEHIHDVSTILGHAAFKVSEKFYIFADTYLAFVLHNKTLAKLAKQGAP